MSNLAPGSNQMIKEHIVTKTIYTIEFEEEELKSLFSVLMCHGSSMTPCNAEMYFRDCRPDLLDLYKELELKFR